MNLIESIKEFGGFLNRYEHISSRCHCKMTFSVYLPPQAQKSAVPALYWLSGLTCTDDNARTKAGMQRYAAEQGIALIFPDTSPRGEGVADIESRYDLGQGAGFYINALKAPWQHHYHMYDYVNTELPESINDHLPMITRIKSISGHSMGGHGALILALKNPDNYRSVSAFAPICNPVKSGWGKGCFEAYLGENRQTWEQYDATMLVSNMLVKNMPVSDDVKFNDILIDQGVADEFYDEGQLLPENFKSACDTVGQNITLRFQTGYDHSYHFIASFIGEHIAYHAAALKNK